MSCAARTRTLAARGRQPRGPGPTRASPRFSDVDLDVVLGREGLRGLELPATQIPRLSADRIAELVHGRRRASGPRRAAAPARDGVAGTVHRSAARLPSGLPDR